jgi:membrane fusion protein (multidrug efflux system)
MATRRSYSVPRLALLLCTAWLVTACGSSDDAAIARPALPVGVITVERQDVPLSLDMVGTTMGIQDVPIRARVEGFLETLNFQEGRFVQEGDLLYTIDDQPFQARVVEAQAKLAASQTNLAKAQADLARIRPLAEMDAVSQQDLDSAVAQEAANRASVRASEASVDLANIELSYTRMYAPITGLIGLSKAKPGEFVGREPNPVVLNTLSDINPIRVRFSISEREYLVLSRTYLSEGAQYKGNPEGRPLNLILLFADNSEHTHRGQVIAAAQAIDPETGTYTLEASFANPDSIVLPGQFARVRAPYRTLKDRVLIPRRALVDLQGRFQVYIVDADNKVEIREVGLGPTKGTMQVIDSGLEGGETIIIEGLQKVRSGTLVSPTIVKQDAPSAPLQET